jgi:hypothetical protein
MLVVAVRWLIFHFLVVTALETVVGHLSFFFEADKSWPKNFDVLIN